MLDNPMICWEKLKPEWDFIAILKGPEVPRALCRNFHPTAAKQISNVTPEDDDFRALVKSKICSKNAHLFYLLVYIGLKFNISGSYFRTVGIMVIMCCCFSKSNHETFWGLHFNSLRMFWCPGVLVQGVVLEIRVKIHPLEKPLYWAWPDKSSSDCLCWYHFSDQ